MKREQLEHILRAASQIADDPDVVVIGSQSILGTTTPKGVSVSTATLSRGWRDRLVLIESRSTQPRRGYALEPHDCVVSKLVADREKDHAFANALIEAGLIDPTIVTARIDTLELDPRVMERLRRWIGMYTSAG